MNKTKDKFIYYMIKLLRGKKIATVYAIQMQIKSMKLKNENDWWFWHKKIMEPWDRDNVKKVIKKDLETLDNVFKK
jgi:hypothetical protein